MTRPELVYLNAFASNFSTAAAIKRGLFYQNVKNSQSTLMQLDVQNLEEYQFLRVMI